MTYKNTQGHTPPPFRHLSLTFSAPSCESPPLYLQPGLRRAVHGNCSSSGACHTACSYPSHAETASPRSSHIWIRRQTVPSRWVQYHPKWPSQAVCFERVWVYVPGVKLFYLEKSKAEFFYILFPASASYRQAQQLITGDMNGSSKCSKEQGVMIGRANGMPLSDKRKLVWHPIDRVAALENICFIVISTNLSLSLT